MRRRPLGRRVQEPRLLLGAGARWRVVKAGETGDAHAGGVVQRPDGPEQCPRSIAEITAQCDIGGRHKWRRVAPKKKSQCPTNRTLALYCDFVEGQSRLLLPAGLAL